jgi:hypothetical protein
MAKFSLRVMLLVLASASAALAQAIPPTDEYVLPDFGPAPVPLPTPPAPSLPPLPSPPLITPPRTPPPTTTLKPIKEQPPFWVPFTAGLGGIAVFGRTLFYGVEAFGLGRIGRPEPRGLQRREVGGWVFEPGGEVAYGRLNGPVCLNAMTACGNRFLGGATVRVGWAQGFAPPSGETSPAQLFFGQLSVLGGATWVPDAPLQPGLTWGELVVRLRAGLHWSLGRMSRFAVVGTLVLEIVPIGAQTQGVMGGASLGIAF